jgi:hypothetical protein
MYNPRIISYHIGNCDSGENTSFASRHVCPTDLPEINFKSITLILKYVDLVSKRQSHIVNSINGLIE